MTPDEIRKLTPDDYAIDPAADLAIQQAATEGPWRTVDTPFLCRDDRAIPRPYEIVIDSVGTGIAITGDIGHEQSATDARAIANAGTHAPAWLRRLIAAEEAILEWDDAEATWTATEQVENMKATVSRYIKAHVRLQELAAQIRAGRETGVQA